VLDEAFRHLLFAEPETAEYVLTEGETAALKLVDAETLEECAFGVAKWLARKKERRSEYMGE
jgi:hypothetical protein